MNSKQVNGLNVISIEDGKKLGAVKKVFFDPNEKRIAGFAVGTGGGLLSADPDSSHHVDAVQIHSVGPDALTLDSAQALRGDEIDNAYSHLQTLDQLEKRKVMTEGGVDVGSVASVDFDERTYQLTGIEVSPGLFQTNRTIPIRHVKRIGDDVVVVADAVTRQMSGDPESDHRLVVGDVEPGSSSER